MEAAGVDDGGMQRPGHSKTLHPTRSDTPPKPYPPPVVGDVIVLVSIALLPPLLPFLVLLLAPPLLARLCCSGRRVLGLLGLVRCCLEIGTPALLSLCKANRAAAANAVSKKCAVGSMHAGCSSRTQRSRSSQSTRRRLLLPREAGQTPLLSCFLPALCQQLMHYCQCIMHSALLGATRWE